MMRILLTIAVAAVFGLAGCEKKEEPKSIGDQINAVQKEAEKTAEEAKPAAEAAAQDAQKTVEEAQKTAEEATK